MGNYLTTQSSLLTVGKVILSDGTVHEFDKPLTVAELMLEYPQQVVVEFHSDLTNNKRPMPLPADKKLERNKVYLMLPMKRGKPASFSSEEARLVLSSATSVLRSRSLLSSSRFLPLFAWICPAGVEEEGRKSVVQKKESEPELLAEILDGRAEYLSRQISGKGWKPSLDTIKEKKVEKKIPHWLFNFKG